MPAERVDCFVDGKPVKDSMSEKAFQLIERIFALESTWKDLPPEKRLEYRQKELKPVLDAYWEHLNSFEAEEKTALYNAQRYSLNQRETLDAVLLDGRLELTNNLAERRREAVCDVAPELLVLRYGKRGNVQCFVFQHDRNSKGKQFGSIWISAVFASGAAQTGRKA